MGQFYPPRSETEWQEKGHNLVDLGNFMIPSRRWNFSVGEEGVQEDLEQLELTEINCDQNLWRLH